MAVGAGVVSVDDTVEVDELLEAFESVLGVVAGDGASVVEAVDGLSGVV